MIKNKLVLTEVMQPNTYGFTGKSVCRNYVPSIISHYLHGKFGSNFFVSNFVKETG